MTVARSASEAPGFSPADRPRVAIAIDGTLAAIQESARIVVVEIPGGAAFAEVGIDSEAGAVEVAWVGAPPRLLVVSRYAAHCTAHLLDPYGPRTIAEIRLESPMKLFATVGAHALVVGSLGAAVLSATDSHLTPYQFPARAVPLAAGAAAGQFVVALAGSVEEWDPQSRMPKRRLRLPRPAVITAVGGSDRVVWMTTQQDPTRIEVMPLVNRGQPKHHELPEPIAHVSGHPRSDLLACVGADSGRLYIVDLDGRTRLRVIGPEGIDRIEAAGLVVGRIVGVLAAQARRPIAIVALEGREREPDPAPTPPTEPREQVPPAKKSTLGAGDSDIATDDEPLDGPPTGVTLSSQLPAPPLATVALEPPPRTKPTTTPPPAAPSLFRHATAMPVTNRAAAAPVAKAVAKESLSERFSSWRDRMRQSQPRSEPPAALAWSDPRPSWRDEVVSWSRSVAAGSVDRAPPSAPALEALAVRCDLPIQITPALILMYGAHLAGEPGAAPIDIARVLGRRWDEALGSGELAARGLAVYADSRVRLASVVQLALDGLPPITGDLVGEPGPIALLGPAVLVSADGALLELAAACISSVGGAILASHTDSEIVELCLEARVRGAVPMLRVSGNELASLPTDPAIFVVDDASAADQLGVPRLG